MFILRLDLIIFLFIFYKRTESVLDFCSGTIPNETKKFIDPPGHNLLSEYETNSYSKKCLSKTSNIFQSMVNTYTCNQYEPKKLIFYIWRAGQFLNKYEYYAGEKDVLYNGKKGFGNDFYSEVLSPLYKKQENKNTGFIFHGFSSDKKYPLPKREYKPFYIRSDFNDGWNWVKRMGEIGSKHPEYHTIIFVDWSLFAFKSKVLDYPKVVEEILPESNLINWFTELLHSMNSDKIKSECWGHSLGSILCGSIGRRLKSVYNEGFVRTIALDSAGQFTNPVTSKAEKHLYMLYKTTTFSSYGRNLLPNKLEQKGDIIVIHSNKFYIKKLNTEVAKLGSNEPHGDVDIYLNWESGKDKFCSTFSACFDYHTEICMHYMSIFFWTSLLNDQITQGLGIDTPDENIENITHRINKSKSPIIYVETNFGNPEYSANMDHIVNLEWEQIRTHFNLTDYNEFLKKFDLEKMVAEAKKVQDKILTNYINQYYYEKFIPKRIELINSNKIKLGSLICYGPLCFGKEMYTGKQAFTFKHDSITFALDKESSIFVDHRNKYKKVIQFIKSFSPDITYVTYDGIVWHYRNFSLYPEFYPTTTKKILPRTVFKKLDKNITPQVPSISTDVISTISSNTNLFKKGSSNHDFSWIGIMLFVIFLIIVLGILFRKLYKKIQDKKSMNNISATYIEEKEMVKIHYLDPPPPYKEIDTLKLLNVENNLKEEIDLGFENKIYKKNDFLYN